VFDKSLQCRPECRPSLFAPWALIQERGAEVPTIGAFISFRDILDLSTPSDRPMFKIIGAMAEFECALTQERVKAGLAIARSKAKTLGRPRTNRKRDKDATRIRQLRDEGKSYREIADELGRSTMDVYRAAMTLGCAGANN